LKKKIALALFSLFLVALSPRQVSSSISFSLNKADVLKPDIAVALRAGIAGVSSIGVNGTTSNATVIAASEAGNHTSTYSPVDYNLNLGSHISGDVPTSLEAVDTDYLIMESDGTATSTTNHNPASYATLFGTWVSGATAELVSDDGSYMTFRSAAGTRVVNVEHYADSNTSNVDSSDGKGTHSDFQAEKSGPDSTYDTLTEKNTGSQIIGYRVQQGRTMLTSATQDITITPVNSMERAFALLTGYYAYGQKDTTPRSGSGGAVGPDAGQFSVYLYNTGTIRVERASAATNVWITWQVIECFNQEFRVYRGSQSYSGTTDTYTVSIGGTVNGSSCLAWVDGATNNQASDSYVNRAFFTAEVSSGLQSTVTLKRAATGTASGNIRWIVVEFDPSKIGSIQTGETTVTTQTQSSRRTVSIASVSASHSLLLFQVRTSSNGLTQLSIAAALDSANQISFYAHTATSYTRYIRWYVIDFGADCGSKQKGQIDRSTDTTWYDVDQPLTVINTSRTISFVSLTSAGAGTNFPRPFPNAYVENGTNLNVWRSYYGQGSWIEWQMLELPYYVMPPNYELDLEAQWQNVDYGKIYEYLCIYTGSLGSENLKIDVRNGSSWTTMISSLQPNQWNNVSIAAYLTSQTFTIRFKGGSETSDTNQDSWQIDATLLHLWSDEFAVEVEFSGNSNTYDWENLNWTIDSAFTVSNVSVSVQLYDWVAGEYASSGDGYVNYISGAANNDERRSQILSYSPSNFRNSTGGWQIKITGVKVAPLEFDLKVDQISYSPSHYSEYSISTEFFIEAATNNPLQLNFTIVSEFDSDAVNVTIQIWNYSSSSYVTGGQGYLNYLSSGTNETKTLSITLNPESYALCGNIQLKIACVLGTVVAYKHKVNQVKLDNTYEPAVYDHVLEVTSQKDYQQKIRLVLYEHNNISRLRNCTVWFSGEPASVQVRIIDGSVVAYNGSWYDTPALSERHIVVHAEKSSSGSSVLYFRVEAVRDRSIIYTCLIKLTID
jgi:hypothetical protein